MLIAHVRDDFVHPLGRCCFAASKISRDKKFCSFLLNLEWDVAAAVETGMVYLDMFFYFKKREVIALIFKAHLHCQGRLRQQ